MNRASRFARASMHLSRAAAEGSDLCEPFLDALPVDGAAVSTLVDPFDVENISASNSSSAWLDQQQLDLGQGPCWVALSDDRPVLVADSRQAEERWPLFQEVANGIFGSMYAFPLRVGSLKIGTVDLYADGRDSLLDDDVSDAVLLARILSTQVLQKALTQLDDVDEDADRRWMTRRVVHQATGMLMAQFRVPSDEAMLILRAHAFATGRPVLDVANDLVDRQITIPS